MYKTILGILAAAFVVLVPLAIWIYTLVFALSSLWFAHYLLAALQSGVVTPSSTAVCNGGYTLGNRRWRCHNERGHGVVDAKRAIQVSCDTYFYRAADLMGIDPIAAVGKQLPGLKQLNLSENRFRPES